MSNFLLFQIILFICLPGGRPTPIEYISIPVDTVPASFPVNFSLFTSDTRQFVAYYNSSHQMTIASRKLNETQWDYQSLDSKTGYDSHNYLALYIENNGVIHLAGNMHSSPLIYFRSTRPYDIHSLNKIDSMTGLQEDEVTYPEFMTGPNNELIFHYRYGVSGSGFEVYNQWLPQRSRWVRLLDQPLTDGQGKMNAYMQGPYLHADGYYHLAWVWRDTPDCATNHTLSYARSKDLLHWESIRGEKVELPITYEDSCLYTDNTPVHGGLINIGVKVGYDSKGRVLIGYHKYDKTGNTQLFVARFQNGTWDCRQVTDWDYRWDFKGYGTIRNELLIEPPKPFSQNQLSFAYHHIKYGNGQVIINEETLKEYRQEPYRPDYPVKIDLIQSSDPEMVVNKVFDSGKSSTGKKFLLRWETLSPNRDQKRENSDLLNSTLEVIEY